MASGPGAAMRAAAVATGGVATPAPRAAAGAEAPRPWTGFAKAASARWGSAVALHAPYTAPTPPARPRSARSPRAAAALAHHGLAVTPQQPAAEPAWADPSHFSQSMPPFAW